MAKLPGAYELMATAASPAINFGRGLLGYQDPFITQTMQDRMAELEAGRTKGNIGYEDYGLQTATPGGRFTGGLMGLALNNPVDFGLAGSIGRYSFSPQGRTGLNYDFTPDQDTGSTGSAMLDFINAGGLKGAFSKMGQAQAAEITPSNTGIMSTPYTDRIMDPGSMRSAAYRSIENEPYQEIPGFNFRDAPTSLMSRMQNPEYSNNPFTGLVQGSLMQRGNPGNSIIDKARSGIMRGLDLGRTGISKGFDLGKSAIGGLAGLVSGIPGLGLALGLGRNIGNMFEDRQISGDGTIVDEFGRSYTADELNSQNALGGYYSEAARSSRRRTNRINNMLERQKLGKKISTKNLAKLQAQEAAQEAAREKATKSMAAANKAAGTGGYQAGYGGDFMGGGNRGTGMGAADKGGSDSMGSS